MTNASHSLTVEHPTMATLHIFHSSNPLLQVNTMEHTVRIQWRQPRSIGLGARTVMVEGHSFIQSTMTKMVPTPFHGATPSALLGLEHVSLPMFARRGSRLCQWTLLRGDGVAKTGHGVHQSFPPITYQSHGISCLWWQQKKGNNTIKLID